MYKVTGDSLRLVPSSGLPDQPDTITQNSTAALPSARSKLVVFVTVACMSLDRQCSPESLIGVQGAAAEYGLRWGAAAQLLTARWESGLLFPAPFLPPLLTKICLQLSPVG